MIQMNEDKQMIKLEKMFFRFTGRALMVSSSYWECCLQGPHLTGAPPYRGPTLQGPHLTGAPPCPQHPVITAQFSLPLIPLQWSCVSVTSNDAAIDVSAEPISNDDNKGN